MPKKLPILIYIIAGICIIAICLTLILKLTGRVHYKVMFPEAVGLKINTKVNMLGIQIGQVSKIELYEDSVIAIFWIKNTKLKQGTHLSLEPINIFGDKELVIYQGKGEYLSPYSTIYGSSQKGLREAIVSLGTFVDHLDSLTREMIYLTYNAQKAFNETVKELEKTMTSVEKEAVQTLKDIREIAVSTNEMLDKSTADFTATIENFREASAHLKSLFETADTLFNTEFYKFIHITAQLDTLISSLAMGKGTAGRLIADETLYIKIDSTVSSLKELLDDIKENPKRYFSIF